MTGLILKRASVSRPSGEWNVDDFDVLADGCHRRPHPESGFLAGRIVVALDAAIRHIKSIEDVWISGHALRLRIVDGGIPNGLARSFHRLLCILECVLGAHEQALNGW
jgi:hypothetical protein